MSDRLRAPLHSEDLAGSYSVPLRSRFFGYQNRLTIDCDGHAGLGLIVDANACSLEGTVSIDGAELDLLDFELMRLEAPTKPHFLGRGWMMEGPEWPRIVAGWR